jgi:hypothetical protein
MPRSQRNWGHQEENRLINEQLAYDWQEQQVYVDRRLTTLNADQNTIYHVVMDSVLNTLGSAFFCIVVEVVAKPIWPNSSLLVFIQ